MAKGHVVARSRDTNGNVMGRSHTNPIIDTRMYQVKFTSYEVIELTTKIIAVNLCPMRFRRE